MDRNAESPVRGPSLSSDRAQLQRPSKVPSLGPEWGRNTLPAPWWEAVVYPCVPPRVRFAAAETGLVPSHPRDHGQGCTKGLERFLLKGGGLVMARIFAVLTALASLFLIVGASTKY